MTRQNSTGWRRLTAAFLALACTRSYTLAAADPPAATSAIVVNDAHATLVETMQNDASISDISFIDCANGWAVGDRGIIWRTSDGGRSWRAQPPGVACRLNAVSFIDSRQGWAVGGTSKPHSRASRGVVLRTQDGGVSWQVLPQSSMPMLTRIKFFDAQRGVAMGVGSEFEPSGVYTTGNGGQTWLPLPTDADGSWLAGDFLDPDTGAVAGQGGKFALLMRRRLVHPDPPDETARAYRALRLAPATGGWLVGDGGLIMATRDLGHSWQTPPGELPDYVREHFDFYAVATVGPHVWVAGSPGTRVFHSADNGKIWEALTTGTNVPLRALWFVDANTGWAAGDLGTIIATTDGGRTWQAQRQGGSRAALLTIVPHETDVPLELLAKLGADEGYLAAVDVLHTGSQGRVAEALSLAGATASHPAWQFPVPPADVTMSPDALLARLNRENDGRALQRMDNHLTGQLRMWRPNVVITRAAPSADSDPFGVLVEQLVGRAIRAAADASECPELAVDVGLQPWHVDRVYRVLPPGSRGDVRIATSQFVPRLASTLADWTTPARQLLQTAGAQPPEFIELQTVVGSPDATPGSTNLFAGIPLPPGGEARRRLSIPPTDDLDKLKRLASRRRQMLALIEHSSSNAAWAGQVANLTDGLDPTSAGELLYQLADGYRAHGRLDLAADTYTLLARSYPEHTLVEPALTWLIQFYASGEAAHRLAGGATNLRQPLADMTNSPLAPPNKGEVSDVRQASAVANIDQDPTPVNGLSRDDRLRRAAALGDYLEAARPSLAREPSVRFPLVVAQRQLGFANPAKRYILTLRELPEKNRWRQYGDAEKWLAEPSDMPPSLPMGHCRPISERPHLDGQLDEPFWEKADPLRLKAADGPSSQPHAQQADVRMTYDRECLYLAIRCPKLKGVEYPLDARPRTRDAALTPFDLVAIRLDVDRDYATAFEFTVDSRGWTQDSCCGDKTWDPTWFVAAGGDDDSWTIEAAIPLADLTTEPPTSRQVWAVAARRTIPGVGFQTWSGNAATDNANDAFGLLIFD